MPFAQWGAPFRNQEQFEDSYPAQFICEAIDQTRGWFYTLMAVGTLVFDRSSYENVLCLGLLLDAEGRKMSKHFGNVLDPFDLFERHGADAVRWLMLAAGSPWADRRVGHEAIEEIVRKVLLTYYNTASFFTLYANASGWWPGRAGAAAGRAVGARPGGHLRAAPAPRRGHRAGELRHLPPAAGWRVSSTACRTGTCAGPAAGSGTATRPPLGPCTSAWTC